MNRYRKKPVIVEAMHNSGATERQADIVGWSNGAARPWFNRRMVIETLEGTMVAEEGDWIIKGVQGEFYPCKADIFDATYERVEADR